MQLLRAIACVSIIAAHCVAYAEISYGLPGGTLDYPLRYSMLNCATLFLSLSGFLLTGELHRGETTPAAFLKKKVFRLYPGYWLAIILAVLLRLAFLQTVQTNGAFWRIFLLLPGEGVPYLLNGEWTMICDVLYYLIAIPFLSKKAIRFFPIFLILWTAGIVAVGCLGWPVMTIQIGLPQFLFITVRLSFVTGCFAWYLFKKATPYLLKLPQFIYWIACIALLLIYALIDQHGATPKLRSPAMVPCPFQQMVGDMTLFPTHL